MKNELSQKEQAALDRKIERLETKIVEVKHNYVHGDRHFYSG